MTLQQLRRKHYAIAFFLSLFGFIFCGILIQRDGTKSGYVLVFSNLELANIVNWDSKEQMVSNDYQYKSSCSKKADRRGPHQKIIAYSIYGNFSDRDLYSRYFGCFQSTLAKVPTIYPGKDVYVLGWVVRIYHNISRDDQNNWAFLQNSLPINRDHIDLCNANEVVEKNNLGTLFPMTWRFTPLLDDLVDMFMSRDSDSQLLPREQTAVDEWLTSNQTYHIMRDHPYHCVPMLGGMWGVKLHEDRANIVGAVANILQGIHNMTYGFDQTLLEREIWPLAQKSMIEHDSYCCGIFQTSRPFSTQRQNGEFVGMRQRNGCDDKSNMDIPMSTCPPQCRPNNSLHWINC